MSESDIWPNPDQKSVVIENSSIAMFCSSGRWSLSIVTVSKVSCVVPCSMMLIRRSVTVRLFETLNIGSGDLGWSEVSIVMPWMASVRWRTRVLKSEFISCL